MGSKQCRATPFFFRLINYFNMNFCDFYLCDTSYNHAFGSVTSTVTLSMTGIFVIRFLVTLCVSCPTEWTLFTTLPPPPTPPPPTAAPPLRFERVDVADALLLPREPRRDPVNIRA